MENLPGTYVLYLKPSTFVLFALTLRFSTKLNPSTLSRAIENGANTIAEGFLFAVAAALILGESWRTSRNQSKRRDSVDDQLDDLGTKVTELTARVDSLINGKEVEVQGEKLR